VPWKKKKRNCGRSMKIGIIIYDGELHYLYPSSTNIRVIKSDRVGLAGCVSHATKM
jgi:hypothetical protein